MPSYVLLYITYITYLLLYTDIDVDKYPFKKDPLCYYISI